MDPEMQRLALIVGLASAALGGVGGFIGARINALTARDVARMNIEAQRALARDNALRDRRARELEALLAHVKERVALFGEIERAGDDGESDKVSHYLRAVSFQSTAWHVLADAARDTRLKAAVASFFDADGDCVAEVQRHIHTSLEEGHPSLPVDIASVGKLIDEAVNVRQAVEEYVFGPSQGELTKA